MNLTGLKKRRKSLAKERRRIRYDIDVMPSRLRRIEAMENKLSDEIRSRQSEYKKRKSAKK